MISKFKTSIDSVGETILQMVKETFRRKFALPGFCYLLNSYRFCHTLNIHKMKFLSDIGKRILQNLFSLKL